MEECSTNRNSSNSTKISDAQIRSSGPVEQDRNGVKVQLPDPSDKQLRKSSANSFHHQERGVANTHNMFRRLRSGLKVASQLPDLSDNPLRCSLKQPFLLFSLLAMLFCATVFVP
jgi:hypothetical protein